MSGPFTVTGVGHLPGGEQQDMAPLGQRPTLSQALHVMVNAYEQAEAAGKEHFHLNVINEATMECYAFVMHPTVLAQRRVS